MLGGYRVPKGVSGKRRADEYRQQSCLPSDDGQHGAHVHLNGNRQVLQEAERVHPRQVPEEHHRRAFPQERAPLRDDALRVRSEVLHWDAAGSDGGGSGGC